MNILAQFTALVQNMLMYFFRKICFISATSEYELMQALKKKKQTQKPKVINHIYLSKRST